MKCFMINYVSLLVIIHKYSNTLLKLLHTHPNLATITGSPAHLKQAAAKPQPSVPTLNHHGPNDAGYLFALVAHDVV